MADFGRNNPILTGFHPDPSICRVGDEYFLATSTFEWFPGVRLHRSHDLSNWQPAGYALTRADQLDMRGNPDSGGVWAPCLTHDGTQFWLVYTNMRRHQGSVKDGLNYVVSAPSIEGPWSAGTFLNSSGFDPSLFHDDNGQSWLAQMLWDHEPAPSHFAGIALQKFDRASRKLTGKRHMITAGTEIGLTEGPHIYKRDGYYHMLLAEGGTGYDHACSWGRAREITGPYEMHPDNPILTSRDAPELALQKAGHGDWVETPDGRSYLVHLVGRPLPGKRCILGRETAIQEMEWGKDGWPRVVGGPHPSPQIDLPPVEPEGPAEYDFAGGLPDAFQWLRSPEPAHLFNTGPDGLTLFGRESIGSFHEQALVARRQTGFAYRAETEVLFDPTDPREQAGITAYYSRHALYFLAITRQGGQRVLRTIAALADSRGGTYSYPGDLVVLPDKAPVKMAAEIDGARLRLFADWGEGERQIGPDHDASILSDEASVGTGGGCFTGAFIGVCAVDMNGHGRPAQIPYFRYLPRGG